MRPRFIPVLLASLPLLTSHAMAEDDFVMTHEEHHVVAGEAPPVMQEESQENDSEKTQAEIDAAAKPKQHPSPELPAGWQTPDEVGASRANSYGNNFGNSGFLANGLTNTNLSGGNNIISNLANGSPSGNALTQMLGTATAGTAIRPVAGNAAIRQPVVPGGYTPVSQVSVGGSSLQGFPAIPPTLLSRGLAGSMSGEGEGDTISSAQDRAMMAAFFSALLQYVMSQPNNGIGNGLGSNALGYNRSAYSSAAVTTPQVARSVVRGTATGSGTPTAVPSGPLRIMPMR